MKSKWSILNGAFLLFALGACAVAPVNRFQSAKTLGAGKGEAGVAFHMSRDVSESFLDESSLDFDDHTAFAGELYGRVGILNRWDIGVRVIEPLLGGSYGLALDNKVQLIDGGIAFPDLAIGLTLGLSEHDSESITFGNREEREYNLYYFDIPLFLSKQITPFFNIYGGGMFSYYSFDGEEKDNQRIKTIEGTTTSGTAFLGLQASLWRFVLTPEIALMSVRNENSKSSKMILFPGMAIGFRF